MKQFPPDCVRDSHRATNSSTPARRPPPTRRAKRRLPLGDRTDPSANPERNHDGCTAYASLFAAARAEALRQIAYAEFFSVPPGDLPVSFAAIVRTPDLR